MQELLITKVRLVFKVTGVTGTAGIDGNQYYIVYAIVVCSTSYTLLILNVVRSLISGLELTGYVAIVHLKLVNLFVEKQVMLPATLYQTLKGIFCVVKIYFLPKYHSS